MERHNGTTDHVDGDNLFRGRNRHPLSSKVPAGRTAQPQSELRDEFPLSTLKRSSYRHAVMSAFDPKRPVLAFSRADIL
jgi:hypothetical protein